MESRDDKIRILPLSELAIILLGKNQDSDLQNQAYREIKRILANNGILRYEAFIEYEEETLNKRGMDISNYLICPNPDAKQYMETYFRYVKINKDFEHGNLLFSEIILYNNKNNHSFFVRSMLSELSNLKRRMKNPNLSSEEREKLKRIFLSIREQIKTTQQSLYEESLTSSVTGALESADCLIKSRKFERITSCRETSKNDTPNNPVTTCFQLLGKEIMDNLKMKKILAQDYKKMSNQRKSIMNSFHQEEVDYSFLNGKTLTYRRDKE